MKPQIAFSLPFMMYPNSIGSFSTKTECETNSDLVLKEFTMIFGYIMNSNTIVQWVE